MIAFRGYVITQSDVFSGYCYDCVCIRDDDLSLLTKRFVNLNDWTQSARREYHATV